MAFFDKNRTGELINRLSADTAVVGRSITDNLSDGLRAVAQAAAGVSMMVSTSPPSVLLLYDLISSVGFYRNMKVSCNLFWEGWSAHTKL